MNRKGALTYSICGIVALVGIIALFSVRVYLARLAGEEQSNKDFGELQNLIVSSYLTKGSFENPLFSDSLRKFTDNRPEILSVVVYDYLSPRYVYSKDPEIIKIDSTIASWKGAPVFLIRPFFENVQSSELPFPGDAGKFASAVYTILPADRLFLFIRDSIFGVAGLLLITLLFIILYSTSNKKPARSTSETGPEPSQKENAGDPSIAEPAEPQQSAETDNAREKPSSGLFSPKTGLCWEQFLDSRLSFELRRSASYDQDLVLILFRGDGIDTDSQEYVDVSKYLLQHFLFQDMLFEYGTQGFAVIMPNTELDYAIKEVESFRKNVCSKSLSSCLFSAGLSSRNGRLINGNRLITEASMALNKAFHNEGDGIIAFRPDPEKYRQYIASKR